ncbi:MAG: NTP transferase domain-containing protein [Acutalibacteraceae bacterium]
MIRHTLEKLAALSLERVTVVSRYEPVREMAAEYGFQALDNPLMLQSESIRLGLAEMAEMDGCMLCVADQPYAPERAWKPCSGCSEEPNPDRRLSYRGQPGNPAIFPRVLFAEISASPAIPAPGK